MLVDIHCHNDPQNAIIEAQQHYQVASTISATSQEEYEKNAALVGVNQKLSYGVHPWSSQTEPINQELLNLADLVGEIGLDNTWTDVPLRVQRPVFRQQLEHASAHHQPVVIHVKGCEKEMVAALRTVPKVQKLIHWYSSSNLLDQYLALPNTWFSVGPDVFNDQAVQNVARRVPLDRLFIESDGFEGIAWALGQKVDTVSYYQTLQRMMNLIAKWRNKSPRALEQQLESNWQAFFELSLKRGWEITQPLCYFKDINVTTR